MNAEFIVYAFVGEVVFAAMAAGALLALAALLKVMPPEVSRGQVADSRHHTQIPANGSPDPMVEQKESVVAGAPTAAEEHEDQAETSAYSPPARISYYM